MFFLDLVPPFFLELNPLRGPKVIRMEPDCIRPIGPCREAARDQSCAGQESKARSTGSVVDVPI